MELHLILQLNPKINIKEEAHVTALNSTRLYQLWVTVKIDPATHKVNPRCSILYNTETRGM